MMLPLPALRLDWSMLELRRIGLVWGASIVALGCSSSDKPATSSAETTVIETDGSAVSCVTDPRVDVYTANLKKPGQLGVLTFTLVASDPAPPARGTNVLKLKIDKDGAPVTGDLAAKLTMPDHGHPTSVQPIVTFDAPTATYTINPAFLFMPGVWRLEFDSYEAAADAGPPLDNGVYYFCIEG